MQIDWNKTGGFYFFSKKIQQEIYKTIGKENYIKLPKIGTNNRGVEFSKIAMQQLIEHKNTKKIDIEWFEEKLDFCVFNRWVELWKEE